MPFEICEFDSNYSRNETPVQLWKPRVGEAVIKTREQLHKLIDSEYPGLIRNPKFADLIKDAELHIELMRVLEGKHSIDRNEIIRIVEGIENKKSFHTNRQYVTALVKNESRPRLYWYLERAVSKSEAQSRLHEIQKKNSGLQSSWDVEARLKTYYPYAGLEKALTHDHRVSQVDKYYQAFEMLRQGGLIADVAKKIDVHRTTVRYWFLGKGRPALVQLARHVPIEHPGEGMKWLPTKIPKASFSPSDFIRVPITVKEWSQVEAVLCQLTSLGNEKLQSWRNRFGEMTKKNAFAYILGMLVGDAAKQSSFQSTDIHLRLSKKYSWSERVGEGFCYLLGKLGIEAKLGASSDGAYQWFSERSPLTTWIMQEILGLMKNECTTYNPIRSDWLLRSSEEIRLKFLQGLNDSDGFVSVSNQYMGIAAGINGVFVKQLLSTFDIDSHYDERYYKVSIWKNESIKRAARLPFFLYATDRQKSAEKLQDMLEARPFTSRKPVPEKIIQRIVKLREQGNSYGKTAEQIFDEHGFSYDRGSIRYHYFKAKRTK